MNETPQPREALEARAKNLELQYPANIKDETLAKKIAEAEALRAGENTEGVNAQEGAGNATASQAGGGASPATENSGPLVVEVTGPARGRRRIGRRFTREPQIIEMDDLSEDDKAALIADETLTIRTYALLQDEG